jgi:hypothetical protein
MCRSIKPLFNYEPSATPEDIQAAALQFVRKISGYRTPSKVNEVAFNRAVADIAHAAEHLLHDLETRAEPRVREVRVHQH